MKTRTPEATPRSAVINSGPISQAEVDLRFTDYNRKSGIFRLVPVARTVNQGGWGAWELSTRWSSTDLRDRGIDADAVMRISGVTGGWK